MERAIVQLGQYPPARQVIAHLSEPHFLAGGAPLHGAAQTVGNLRQALTQLERSDHRITALVFTGDLTDLGEPDAYERLRGLVEPFAARMGAQLIWVMGNHDERPEYSRILMREEPSDEPQDRVYDLDGLRLIVLDTSVPGYHHGELSDAQLDWLRDELRTAAPRGTMLALHHPPIPTILEVMATLELLDQHKLEEVVRGTDVRGILGGHLHYATTSMFAGVPVSVAPATCYALSLTARDRLLSGLDGGQAFNLVHVYDDRIVHSVVPIGEFDEISALGADALPGIVAMTPEERREQLSAKRSFANLGDEPGS
jgi:3',5'-cyclic AMP phosphodiesterase CpdA